MPFDLNPQKDGSDSTPGSGRLVGEVVVVIPAHRFRAEESPRAALPKVSVGTPPAEIGVNILRYVRVKGGA